MANTPKITDVMALPRGGYQVTFANGSAEQLAADAPALATWLRAGNRARSYLPTREEARAAALDRIKRMHGRMLRELTNSPTKEETDTWPTKRAAAQFVQDADDAALSAAVAALGAGDDPHALSILVADVGTDVDALRALAGRIMAKSAAYLALCGKASRVKRDAEAAVATATGDDVAPEDIAERIREAEVAMLAQMQREIEAWRG